jgi:uncharacterized protein YigA (DUF484 family)
LGLDRAEHRLIMEQAPASGISLRDAILTDPSLVLDDPDVMARLLAVAGGADSTVVDLRGALVERLKTKLGALEETHRSVLAAAYDSVSGTQAVHRAVLSLMDLKSFMELLGALADDLPRALGVDAALLVFEDKSGGMAGLAGLRVMPVGGIAAYRGDLEGIAPRKVHLQQSPPQGLFDTTIGSEALMALDLGEGRRTAMLALGAADPMRFSADQGTDLLQFFASVFERSLRRWLE